jgi:hypothetical protein
MNKDDISKVVDFCFEYNIPHLGKQIELYELYHNDMYDKFSNKHTAEIEIFSEWKNALRAYWDEDLIKYLHKRNYETR